MSVNTNSLVRILVVDDYAPWQRFVVAKLQERSNLYIIGIVLDGFDAVQKAEELQPDLVLMDVCLPKMSGIEAARQIRKRAPKSKILFVSQNFDFDVAQAALNAGGRGYVIKSDAERDLLAAVEAVVLGERFVSRRLEGLLFNDTSGA